MRLSGKIALITGANKGIGKAIALAFAREGADIAAAARDIPTLEEVAGQIRSLGRRVLVVKCDVSKSSEVQEMVKKTVETFGRIDILVNNAGVVTRAFVVNMTEDEWDYNLDVNTKGTFLCSKFIAQQMIKQGKGGKIVNIASRAGRVGVAGLAHYSASKFAVVGFTQALAVELAFYKVNVNAICPGKIATEMMAREIVWEAKERGVSIAEIEKEQYGPVPWGRPGTPEDIAAAAVFLASPESDYITGTTINVTGGIDVVRGGQT